jgi:hypothetical protein
MSRWENASDLRSMIRLGRVMLDLARPLPRPPAAVTLDIDYTCDVATATSSCRCSTPTTTPRCFLPIHVYEVASHPAGSRTHRTHISTESGRVRASAKPEKAQDDNNDDNHSNNPEDVVHSWLPYTYELIPLVQEIVDALPAHASPDHRTSVTQRTHRTRQHSPRRSPDALTYVSNLNRAGRSLSHPALFL